MKTFSYILHATCPVRKLDSFTDGRVLLHLMMAVMMIMMMMMTITCLS